MAYHKSNLGMFGNGIHTDIDGYVPEASDGPWDLNYDHGSEDTHNDDGSLTEYGQWWVEERFPEIQEEALRATAEAEGRIREWRAN